MLKEYKLHTELHTVFSDFTSETADSCKPESSTMLLSSGTEVLTGFGSDCRVRNGGAVT